MKGLNQHLSQWTAILAMTAAVASPAYAQDGGGAAPAAPATPAAPTQTPTRGAVPTLLPSPAPAADAGGDLGAAADAMGGDAGDAAGIQGNEEFGETTPNDAVIQVDPETGSLIVIADPATAAAVGRVIQTMDQPIPQVLIKVLFLEVTHSQDDDIGVEASYSYDTKNNNVSQVLTNFGVGAETRGGFYRILDKDLSATLRALSTVSKLEVLSRPSILTRNNQDATITVGQSVPFITNTRIDTSGNQINTIQYQDIGIILEVQPYITPDRMVQMYVAPEISTLTAETVPISETVNARVIAKRSAETNVVVPDGKTVVIGGMMEDNNTDQINKIPILGDIPYLGAFFRRTQTSKSKTELLIFLTPIVVDGPQQLQEASVRENNKAELPPKSFTQEQYDKYIDDLGAGSNGWKQNP